ncbi:hypothetical protein MesoLjLb_75740 [Mesorhizobium sp. L-8-3]|nr:hypothetical protein MesoLjLb_75740 [Mesorhizobium sp. L-8-3]
MPIVGGGRSAVPASQSASNFRDAFAALRQAGQIRLNPALSLPFLDIFSRRSEVSEVVSATRVLWGQIMVVFTIVLVAV